MGLNRVQATIALVLALMVAAPPAVVRAQSADDLTKLGKAQTDAGKDDDAVKTLEKALKLDPKSAEAHYRLGNALGNVAQKANVLRQPFLAKRVESEFEKAVELDPSLLGAHEGLMQFYLQAPGVMGGSIAKAREQATAIGRLNAFRGHIADANIANHEKDLPGAERAHRAAYAEFPDSVNSFTNLVNFLAAHNRADEAFTLIDHYLASKPNDRLGLWQVGRTAALSGKQLERGEQALRTVLTMPEIENGVRIPRENAHFRLGDILAKRGDKAKARAEYEEALKINPKLEAAKKALVAL